MKRKWPWIAIAGGLCQTGIGGDRLRGQLHAKRQSDGGMFALAITAVTSGSQRRWCCGPPAGVRQARSRPWV